MYKNTNQYLENQLNFLSSLIFPNGEFVMHNTPSDNSYKIVPYFSNIASLALLGQKYLSKVKDYLVWYISHLNFPDKFGSTCTIYDYYLKTNGELVSTNDYDSNDSYPATFLTLCKEYYLASNDISFFTTNKRYIDCITASMLSTMDSDYLTWAKPNYKVKYLMDNCEVIKGIRDAIFIYCKIFNDNLMTAKLTNADKNITVAVENNFWDNKQNIYYSQIGENGSKNSPNQNVWYPDATSQLFPILSDIIEPQSQRAKLIYQRFNDYQSDWFYKKDDGSFPDAYVGYVALLMKDYDKVNTFLKFCQDKYINNGNQWPWYNVESSYYIRIINGLNNLK